MIRNVLLHDTAHKHIKVRDPICNIRLPDVLGCALGTVDGNLDVLEDIERCDGVLLVMLLAALVAGGVVVKGKHLAVVIQMKCNPLLEIRSDQQALSCHEA